MRRRGNSSALWALLFAGGAWAWQNRDKIRNWAESNPQVRDKVNQLAQSNPQVRNLLEKQVGWQIQQSGGSSSQQYGTGSYNAGTTGANNTTGSNYNGGTTAGTNYPSTGETRRISPNDTDQDARGSGI